MQYSVAWTIIYSGDNYMTRMFNKEFPDVMPFETMYIFIQIYALSGYEPETAVLM
jgi:hypothetical protein